MKNLHDRNLPIIKFSVNGQSFGEEGTTQIRVISRKTIVKEQKDPSFSQQTIKETCKIEI